jgi:hypothetical protein
VIQRCLAGLFLAALMVMAHFASAADSTKEPVDRMLVLAMDVSDSVNDTRYALQIKGYANAFRDPETIRTITNGPQGAVAVTMAQWGGWGDFEQTVPWTIIRNRADALRFADAVEASERRLMLATSISWALIKSAALIEAAPYTAGRRIIDISGDGPDETEYLSNTLSSLPGQKSDLEKIIKEAHAKAGTLRFASLRETRQSVCGAGIEVNGLAIEGADGVEDLTGYYRAHVICRKGSFVIKVEDPDSYAEFAQAILRKIRHELAF